MVSIHWMVLNIFEKLYKRGTAKIFGCQIRKKSAIESERAKRLFRCSLKNTATDGHIRQLEYVS